MLTDQQLEEFRQDFNSGMKVRELKKKYSIGSNGYFYRILDKLGIESRNANNQNKYPTKEELEQYYIIENHTFKDTKEHFNLCTNTFYKLVETYSLYKPIEQMLDNVKKTNLERYGVENIRQCKEINDKIAQTNLERYGSISPFGNKEVQEKTKQTFETNYGCHPRSTKEVQEKQKQTCLKKYGVDNVSKLQEIKDKIGESNREAYSTNIPQQKTKQTCLDKYGVSSPKRLHYTDKAKEALLNKESFKEYILSIPSKLRTKHYIAEDLGVHTTNIGPKLKKWDLSDLIYWWPVESEPERKSRELLVEKFGEDDVVWQYQDTRYADPNNSICFKCDFYIKSLDLFIEGQYGPHHQNEPFDPDNKDHQDALVYLKKKYYETNSNWYNRMIQTWTYRDPLKRETAKMNNLNWKEFFTVKDLKEWLKSI